MKEQSPHLIRSSLYRLFQRHGISPIPKINPKTLPKKKFQNYPVRYVHIDIAEVRTEEGKLYLFVAIDRTTKFSYVELLAGWSKMEAADFLRNLVKMVPYQMHTLLTDNGI